MQEDLIIKTAVKVGVGGRIFIPAVIRKKTGIKKGQELEIRLHKMGGTWMITLQEVKSG